MAEAKAVRVGLVGAGIQASLSPALHMHEGTEQGFDYHYELFDLDHIEGGAPALASLLETAERRGFAGLNITHPCKQSVLPLLDGLSEDAATLGAVNTIVFADGDRVGHNTDWWGFAESFRRGLPHVSTREVLLLGAGGAGAAVCYALLKLGTQSLTMFDIDTSRSRALAEKMSRAFPKQHVAVATSVPDAMRVANGVVNATTVGMAKHPGLPVPVASLDARQWVAEIVYFPLETELLRHARALGCRTLDGGGMAVFQAVEAFRLFTGVKPDADRMLNHFDVLARQRRSDSP